MYVSAQENGREYLLLKPQDSCIYMYPLYTLF